MLLTSRQTYHEVRGINYSLTVFNITGVSHFEHTGPSLNTAFRSRIINIVASEWQVEKLILLQWILPIQTVVLPHLRRVCVRYEHQVSNEKMNSEVLQQLYGDRDLEVCFELEK
jgi:hypothetical protein